ncbi:hypothetical protein Tco_1493635 [Tanacetum coccineum]
MGIKYPFLNRTPDSIVYWPILARRARASLLSDGTMPSLPSINDGSPSSYLLPLLTIASTILDRPLTVFIQDLDKYLLGKVVERHVASFRSIHHLRLFLLLVSFPNGEGLIGDYSLALASI